MTEPGKDGGGRSRSDEDPAAPPTANDSTGPGAAGGPRRKRPREIGGPRGPEPTRYGDWERNGRCSDF